MIFCSMSFDNWKEFRFKKAHFHDFEAVDGQNYDRSGEQDRWSLEESLFKEKRTHVAV